MTRNNERKSAALCFFAKLPIPGAVKTRLGRSIGMEEAARVCEALLRYSLDRLYGDGRAWDAYICHAAAEGAAEWFAELAQEHGMSGAFEQVEGDLGERMVGCVREILGRGYAMAVLAGGDCPDLSPEIVASAVEALDACDVVLGPADDGGYYLIGMKEPHRQLFEGIEWSTPGVFAETIKKIEACNLSYALFPMLSDIDTVEDLRNIPPDTPLAKKLK